MKQGMAVLVALVIAAPALAHDATPAKAATGHPIYNLGDIQWVDAPPSVPAGAKMAVLKGDPSSEGIFVIRLKAPDGYRVMPHWHPTWEHVTVISGTLNMGMGETFDKTKGKAIQTGGFAAMPPMMRHFAWMTGETVVEVVGSGPWQLYYVNPADNPAPQAEAK